MLHLHLSPSTVFLIFCLHIAVLARIVPLPATCRFQQQSVSLPLSLQTPQQTDDKLALIALKKRVSADPLNLLSDWNDSDASPCRWTGVSCNEASRVIGLDLKLSNLSATIPPELGSIEYLVHLNLSVNNFSGTIPPEIGRLTSLTHLDFKWNQLAGVIPSQLGYCRALYWLDLSHNLFTGTIPSSLGSLSHLYMLQLHDISNLTGTIPPELGLLKNLNYLYLGSNSLIGRIPPELGRLENLVEITLFLNKLNGSIPSELGQLRNLQVLSGFLNGFEGSIPPELGNLTNLRYLYLFNCNLEGIIPPELGNLANLLVLDLYNNRLTGSIPSELGQLENLQELKLFGNNLNGSIPVDIGKLRNLQHLFLYGNSLSGILPKELGRLEKLQNLYLYSNNLTGTLPAELGQLQNLQVFIIFSNRFHGNIPPEFGQLKSLVSLYLGNNSLSGGIPPELGMLSNLQYLEMNINNISGEIPSTLANLSNLTYIHLSNNRLSGDLPPGLANCTRLQWIKLFNNAFHGEIPTEYSSLRQLHTLALSNNNLGGAVPTFFANHSSLVVLDLRHNKFTGILPDSWGQSENLRVLTLGYNCFEGNLPFWLWKLKQLQVLDLSSNNFTGSIPYSLNQLKGFQWDGNAQGDKEALWQDNIIINAKGAEADYKYVLAMTKSFDLSGNRINGHIPQELGLLNGLFNLNLSRNMLTGSIPSSLGNISTLESLDLSNNQLDGPIPQKLASLTFLSALNLSNNSLSGSIPRGGQFDSFSNESFLGNPQLCGLPLPVLCMVADVQPAPTSARGSHHTLSWSKRLAIVIGSIVVAVCTFIITIFWLYNKYYSKQKSGMEMQEIGLYLFGRSLQVTAADLFNATNGYSDNNIIGKGGCSIVYRGVLSDGKTVAIKKLHASIEAQHSLLAECKTLGQIRHKNLVRILGVYCSPGSKALILEYIENGSLESHLHKGEVCQLSWEIRLKVAKGVAQGMSYLHNDSGFGQVLHCDLKPSNILLDKEFEPHIADFGIARLIQPGIDGATMGQSTFKGSIGYVAPEYVYLERITNKVDVYSFGILLLEMVTRRRPTSDMFSESTTLQGWVQSAFPDKVLELIDPVLHNAATKESYHGIICLLKLGLLCCQSIPMNRPSMKEVVDVLQYITPDANHSGTSTDSVIISLMKGNISLDYPLVDTTISSSVTSDLFDMDMTIPSD